jgi:hypothetical protein
MHLPCPRLAARQISVLATWQPSHAPTRCRVLACRRVALAKRVERVCHFPERVFGVKGRLANFVRGFSAKPGEASRIDISGCLKIAFRGSGCRSMGLSRSGFRGCRAVLFSAAAPQHIPSWIRLPIAATGRIEATDFRPSLARPDTEYFLRPPRTARAVSIRLTLGSEAESKWHIRLATAGESLSPGG